MAGDLGVGIITEDQIAISQHQHGINISGTKLMSQDGFFDFPKQVSFARGDGKEEFMGEHERRISEIRFRNY